MDKSRIVVLSRHANVFGYEGIRGLIVRGVLPQLIILPVPDKKIDLRDFPLLSSAQKYFSNIRTRLTGRQDLRFRESISRLCSAHSVPLAHQKIGNQEELSRLIRKQAPDILLVLGGWPELLRPEVISIAKIATVNLHPALLPLFRGGDVHRWQILKEANSFGFTFHHMNEKFDSGPTILQKTVRVNRPVPPQTLSMILAREAGLLVHDAILGAHGPSKHISTGKVNCPKDSTYFPKWDWRNTEFFALDWTLPARKIQAYLLAASQEAMHFAGFFSQFGNTTFIIREGEERPVSSPARFGAPGTVWFEKNSSSFFVRCGDHASALRLVRLQIGGRRGVPQYPKKFVHIDLNRVLGRWIFFLILRAGGVRFER